MKNILLIILLILTSCSNFLSDEELQERFDNAYEKQNWQTSKLLIDEVIKRNPDSTDFYVLRAIIESHQEKRNHVQIINDLNKYLKKYPEDNIIKVFRFQSYYLNNQSDKALKEVDLLIEKKRKNTFLLTWKANIAFSLKKFDIAEQAYKERMYFESSYEESKNVYYYWMLSKYFGGNKEGAMWDCAFLSNRGFEDDDIFLKKIENDELKFDDYNNFVVPNSNFQEIEAALNNYCSDLNIFQGKNYYRSELLGQFFYLEKAGNLDSLLTHKEDVYSLNLSSSGLKELPKQLFQFKNLQYLNLSSNRFTDNEKLFDDLAKLPNLIILEMDRCYLRALPDNVNKLTNLQMLSLTFNDFRVINENLGGLTNLKYLNLGANGKLRDLPKSIGNLRCLQMLNVSPNGLNRLRDELAQCNQLVSIVANAGTIKTLPNDMGGLVNLKYANLGANKIQKLPESIGDLSSLEDLSLGSNDIKVLPYTFSNLKQLKSCGLGYNRFTQFPQQVLKLDSLNSLWLYNNSFKEIPEDIARLPKLNQLLVDHQLISDENIRQLEKINPELNVVKHDTRRYVKGSKRKN